MVHRQAIRLVEQLYPQGRQVFLVRDFRDMVASVYSFNARRGFAGVGRQFASSDAAYLSRLADQVRKLHRYWLERRHDSVLVRYEDLVLQPAPVLQRVFAYLGVDDSASTVAGVIARASREDAQTRAHVTAGSPAASVGRWRRDLDPALARAIEDLTGPVLEAFGYSLGGKRAA
jgi:hypothetical protein